MEALLEKLALRAFGTATDLGATTQHVAGAFPAGLPRAAASAAAAALFHARRAQGDSVLFVVNSNQEAESLAAEAELFLPSQEVLFFPGLEGIPYEYAPAGRRISLARMRSLHELLGGKPMLVFAAVDAYLRKLPAPRYLKDRSLTASVGLRLEPTDLCAHLVEVGYEHDTIVELPGSFSAKGSVVDVFPANTDQPVRLEFFDDELESIRFFDPDTQVGSHKLEAVDIMPAGEVALSSEESRRLTAILAERADVQLEAPAWIESDAEGAGAHLSLLHHHGVQELFGLVQDAVGLEQYFDRAPTTVIYPHAAVLERRESLLREYDTLYERESTARVCLPPRELIEAEGFPGEPGSGPALLLDSVADNSAEALRDLEDSGPAAPPVAPTEVGAVIRSATTFRGRIREMRAQIGELVAAGHMVCIVSPYEAQLRRLNGIFAGESGDEDRLKTIACTPEDFPSAKRRKGKLILVRAPLRAGWEVPARGKDPAIHFWTDGDLFGRSYRKRSHFKQSTSAPIDSFVDLKIGDHVVHVNHGIGKFVKLERVPAAGRERDFLVLEYAGDDRLFVPLDQISLVQRYIASNDNPRLDSLGKASFKKVRARVEKRIEELAEKLIEIYAVRMSHKGYRFPPDTVWQEEFEADFAHDETPDQLTAIESVKDDMESERPMDRLICGDVGYGKTEVAIRAAFKAVMAGRQAVVLAPTTILALQHFRTFSERFRNYPVAVDWISRFRSAREVTEVKRKLAAGEVDIVVGTHALLSGDVQPKNLGLLVVDEEQRFGVGHKEAIKGMRRLVDVLTLSATPIPRTLHMSLVGIRDLSVIQTPPRDRLPVRTFVMEDSDTILKEAIKREIERNGQVFYLHNRVETIEVTARRIQNLVPRAGLRVLHGQMPEEQIEDTLIDFLEHRYDVLVTTTIIESGIDMPNVNTLIVDSADRFGLSQLYQIRGRVGRSDRQAYAYMMHGAGRALSETAQKRLNTIQEYQELGSGFKVAMRDLEIRGAGNLLGSEQSGDIMDVGFELYVRLLETAVRRLQGKTVEEDVRCNLSLDADFYLPEEYIPDSRQRIEFYKRFEAAADLDSVLALAQEMRDRFGTPTEAARSFVELEKIRTLSGMIGFESVFQEKDGSVRLVTGQNFHAPVQHLVQVVSARSDLTILPGTQQRLHFQPRKRPDPSVISGLLEELAAPLLASA